MMRICVYVCVTREQKLIKIKYKKKSVCECIGSRNLIHINDMKKNQEKKLDRLKKKQNQ